METKDLIRLRKLLSKELKRRERIKELESNNDIIEYLNLMGITKIN